MHERVEGRVVVVSQVHFLPRLHHVKRIVDCDVLVLLDDVQFGPDWQRRTVIKTPQGVQYFTVPVRGGQRQHIRDVLIDNEQSWQKKSIRSLEHCYGRAPYFDKIIGQLEPMLYGQTRLYELSRLLLRWVITGLGIEVKVVEQSKLGRFTERKTDLMVALVRAIGGDVYHCGKEATEQFYAMDKFADAGIRVWPQEWTNLEYPQKWGEFAPGLSVIDALFNVGFDGTRDLLDLENCDDHNR